MIPLLGSPPPALEGSLHATLARALEDGAPAPPWIAVEGEDGGWLEELLSQPVLLRRRGVAAVRTERGLVAALRAEVGGAVWIPPSSPTMAEATAAAAGRAAPPKRLSAGAAAILRCASPGKDWLLVGFRHGDMWRHQLGEGVLEGMLGRLAEALGEEPLIIEWPALVVRGDRWKKIRKAWRELAETPAPDHGLSVTRWPSAGHDVSESELKKLLEEDANGGDEDGPEPTRVHPVYDLPSGRFLGRWSMGTAAEGSPPGGEGWLATAVVLDSGRMRWRIEAPRGERLQLAEVLASREIESMEEGTAAARIPGWAVADLRPGAPGRLLLERLARAAEIRGIPLWVPNLDDERLREVLRIGGRFWVDGPAVPASPA